jgi:hypothetical protein
MTRLSVQMARRERMTIVPAPLAEYDPLADSVWLALLVARSALAALFALLVLAYALGG